jgi:hypothetical protein
MNTRSTRLSGAVGWAAAALAAAALTMSCTATERVKVERPGSCALIPPTICAQLTPGTSAQPGLRYVNPNAQLTSYTKLLINPVTYWGGETDKISAAEQQALTNYLYQEFLTTLSAKFPIVDEPGPGVLRIQAAIMDATAATPVLRTISMVVPQARALATLGYLATGTYAFVGGLQGEMLVTDSVTGVVVAAGVDRRVGGGSIETAAQWQWGDAEHVMDKWAEITATRLSVLTSGKAAAN